MGLFDLFRPADPEAQVRQEASRQRLAEIKGSLRTGVVPAGIRMRLEGTRAGRLPWTATLTLAELMIVRSHGLRPVASVSATCWMHYGFSWTQGHAQGWETALRRLRAEAKAASANVVLDVKMRTLPLGGQSSMDFTLVGTAAYVEGLPPSAEPVVATVPALEFVKLLEADVVTTGIAIGAEYEWLTDWRGAANLDGQRGVGRTQPILGQGAASGPRRTAAERQDSGQRCPGPCQFQPDVRGRAEGQPTTIPWPAHHRCHNRGRPARRPVPAQGLRGR